jgi:erythromycin esterase
MRMDQPFRWRALTAVASVAASGWLGVASCGGSPSAPGANPSATASPASAGVRRRPAPPPVQGAWDEWVRAHHSAIRSVSAADTDFADLQFLEDAIGARSLLQLGESGHGVAEFDSVKARLIRFLHEEMGFDVIAFESGLYECFRADELAAEVDPLSTMRASIFPVWHADETLTLFEYLKATKATGRPLTLAGFDTQFSTIPYAGRAEDLAMLIGAVDPAFAEEARALDLELARLAYLPLAQAAAEITPKVGQMTASYEGVADWIEGHLSELQRAFPARPRYPAVMAQAMRMAPFEVRCLAAGSTGDEYGRIRDEGMADNITFLKEQLFPGRKIVVWAHNAHVQHDPGELGRGRNMGSYVVERHRQQLYTVGLYMYWGDVATNDRTVYFVAQPSPDSLEAIMGRASPPASFVDLLGQDPTPGTTWMYQPIPSLSWGTTVERWTLRRQYDGILFVDEVHPPHYK